MIRRHTTSLAFITTLLAAGLAVAAPPKAAPAQGAHPADFRSLFRGATTKVFPAVVYVRCIRETHAGGKRTTQELSESGVLVSPKGDRTTSPASDCASPLLAAPPRTARSARRRAPG